MSEEDEQEPQRRSLADEATELVEAVRTWSATPEVRAQLATAAASLLQAGAALLDTVAERKRADESGAGGDPAEVDEPEADGPEAT